MEKSGIFNSSGGDRVYNAVDFAAYFGRLVSNGIFYAAASNLQVNVSTGMGIVVQPGAAWIGGYSYENTAPLNMALATADGINPRIDRVVIRWSAINRAINLAVLTGAAASTPVAHTLTRNNDIWELGIADIAVGKGVVSLTSGNITDTRMNAALCGLVNSLVSAVYE
ncbi:MAG: hypothetical protein FWE69_08400 [Clostridiales bacterium]|nr:hypothetical protein [Clostridiales bacterium]